MMIGVRWVSPTIRAHPWLVAEERSCPVQPLGVELAGGAEQAECFVRMGVGGAVSGSYLWTGDEENWGASKKVPSTRRSS